ncbi:hypothetical protein [Catalinimonas alkaloidigena]|nr:hypothetical protein [Catalinimonas alkaloidigena]
MYTDWVLNILLEVLYPYQEYDQQQLRRTRAYIQQWFVHLPQERWGGQYQDMIEGIGMAGKWVEKSPKRYVVVPWLYMDLSKRRYGFVNVMELWLGKKRRGKSTTWSKLATRNVALQMIGRAFREGKQGQDLKKVLDHAVTMVRSLRCERSWNAFARMVEQMATDQAVDMSSSGHSFHRRAV